MTGSADLLHVWKKDLSLECHSLEAAKESADKIGHNLFEILDHSAN